MNRETYHLIETYMLSCMEDSAHDIGRKEQFSERVKQCITTHRYRKNNLPQSIEAKILFDADKLDVTGAIGVARTLLYHGEMGERLYMVSPDGSISDGTKDSEATFFKEYKHKLEKLYSKFFTKKGNELAAKREQAAKEFYEHLYAEVCESHTYGKDELFSILRLKDTDCRDKINRGNQ